MLLHIIAVGKIGRSPEADLVQRYLARIPWPVRVTELAEGKAAEPSPGAKTVTLDERGKPLTSIQFSRQLSAWRDEGVREARFLIGGADGHDDAARSGADLTLSFGALTWPHMLARAMLAEQLYRATSIAAGHPYHRGAA